MYIHTKKKKKKKDQVVDTPFYTYQNPESPVPMTVLFFLSKTTLNSEPKKKVYNRPKAQTKSWKPKPNQASVFFFPRGVRILHGCLRHLNMLHLSQSDSRWHTPLQRGLRRLQSGIRKVETYLTNHSISIWVSISHVRSWQRSTRVSEFRPHQPLPSIF